MNNVTHDNGYLVSKLQTTYITHTKKFLILQGTEKLLSTNKGLDKKTPAEFRSTTAEWLFFFPGVFCGLTWELPLMDNTEYMLVRLESKSSQTEGIREGKLSI
jgi:hypothetical protein